MGNDFKIHSKRVEIKSNGFGRGTVKLDGLDVSSAVKSVRFESTAEGLDGTPDSVEIGLSISEIEITLFADPHRTIQVWFPTAVVELLTRLGWTPPADGATTYQIPHEPVCTCALGRLAADDGVHRADCPMVQSTSFRLPPNCHCFELDAHEHFYATGEHDERCPLWAPAERVCTCSMGEQFANGHHRDCPCFIIDNQSPDAND